MTGQDYCYMQTFNTRTGLPSNNISGMAQDSHGLMWIATWNGLCCYDGYQFTTFRTPDDGSAVLTTNRIDKIRIDSVDNIWLFTHDNHYYLFDTHTCRYQNLPDTVTNNINYPADYVRKVNANSGRGWRISDERQLMIDNTVTLIGSAADLQPKIEHHFIDRQQNLWFNSARGLSQLTIRKQRTQFVDVRAGERVRSVCCRHDGSVWAGTMEGYLAVFDSDGHLQGWLSPQGTIVGSSVRFSQHIYALFEDSQHRLWIGTKGAGLYILDAQGRLTHLMPDKENAYSINSAEIYDFDEDASGNIWIATFSGGVNVCAMPELRFIHCNNDLRHYPKEQFRKVRRITHTADGLVIASTTSGLLTIDAGKKADWSKARIQTACHEQDNTASLRTNDVMQTLVTRNGVIYVATLGGGIQQVTLNSLRSGRPQFSWMDYLNTTAGNVQSLTEDKTGNIWICRDMSIECYQPVSQNLIRYGANSMAGEIEMAEAMSAVDGKGDIWLPANDGMVTFTPQDMQPSQYRPDIVFTGLLYQGERTTHPLLYRPSLTLNPQQRNLTVTFAAIDYSDNDLVQYAYRMDNSQQWNYIGTTPRISFSDLPPGHHTLVVKSTNSDGVWVDNDTQLVIDVTPTLWERTWVRVICLLLVIVLSTWAVMRYLRHRQHEREREQRLESILRQYRELNEDKSPLNPSPSTFNPSPSTLNPSPSTINPSPSTFNPSPSTINPSPPTLHPHYTLSEPVIENPDEKMTNQLMAYIEEHMADEDLKIDQMAEAVGMSRTVLYGKIKQLMGVSPSDFLRQVRMQRAEQLIAKSKMSIAEVAYAVGFSDPKYFTKCFKKETGMTPSEYRNAL